MNHRLAALTSNAIRLEVGCASREDVNRKTARDQLSRLPRHQGFYNLKLATFVTSTECTKPQVTIAAGVIKMMTRGRWWRDGLLSQSWLLPVGHLVQLWVGRNLQRGPPHTRVRDSHLMGGPVPKTCLSLSPFRRPNSACIAGFR